MEQRNVWAVSSGLKIKGYTEEVTSKRVVFYQEKNVSEYVELRNETAKECKKEKQEKFTKNLKLVI